MPKTDARAHLEAVARGEKVPGVDEAPGLVNEGFAQKHATAFRAWAAFAMNSRSETRGGEPLHAPADLLTPLP